MNAEARRWLAFAREDLRLAELSLSAELWNGACFQAQLCAERALKALLAAEGFYPPRSHKLADLLYVLGDGRLPGLADDLLALDRFYLTARYPDLLPGSPPEGLPGRDEAEEAVGTVRRLMDEEILQGG